jgi:hypothetical protein
MTRRQFQEACARNGFKPQGFLGYYDIGGGCCVCSLNAGGNRRNRLAYLLREREQWQAKEKGMDLASLNSEVRP